VVQSVIAVVVVFGALLGFLFWQSGAGTVFVENSALVAPVVNLSPTAPGILNALYVKEGDRILPNSQVALVGSQILTSQTGGLVSSASEVLGAYFNPGQTVVSIVNDKAMKVVGTVDETKGLKDIAPGQRATFSVDAFPGKTYNGTVDEVSPTSNNTGILFSISDTRPVNKFNVKVRFNVSDYPELKNGMSAKITVYTK
jgi:multidrug resistance efflux pump